jgi:dGTPase
MGFLLNRALKIHSNREETMTPYSQFLSTERLRPSDVEGRTIVAESESDRGRVLFCAAFRRLQQKAQVFSMEPNAAVRSRLTHSLEVSQLGRYIADQIAERLDANAMSYDERSAFVNFVETACLMHDIGNPPFGHFGEAAIKKWFGDNGAKCLRDAIPEEQNFSPEDPRRVGALEDFIEFDGNPQGLRVVARLQWNTDEFGLNLTKTTLASYIKYVRCSGEIGSGRFTKKAGYFSTERDVVLSLWDQFGFSTPQRFPLAYVMEAADDIAYCVSDLEDSVEKGLVHLPTAMEKIRESFLARTSGDEGEVKADIESALNAICRGTRDDGKEYTYTDFRTSINRAIVRFAATRYVAEHDKIVKGELDGLLPKSSAAGAILETLEQYCRTHVYGHVSIQRVELAGFAAIEGLLEHFRPLLQCTRHRFLAALDKKRADEQGVPIVIKSKLLSLFPERYIKVYRHCTSGLGSGTDAEIREWNARAHLVVDFIAGMTDDFAMTTYRTLSGMRL